jgi:hypothetical protein
MDAFSKLNMNYYQIVEVKNNMVPKSRKIASLSKFRTKSMIIEDINSYVCIIFELFVSGICSHDGERSLLVLDLLLYYHYIINT